MQRAVDEIVLEAVIDEVLIEFLCDIASHHAGLHLLTRPLMRLTAELDDVAALTLELSKADRIADGGGIAVDLGRQVQLDDVALLELAVAGAGNGVSRGRLGKDVHRKALILCAVFVDHALRHADHLKLGHAGANFLDNLLCRKIGQAIALTQAGKLVFGLDLPQLGHDIAGVDKFRAGERVADGLIDGHGRVEEGRDADAELLSGHADGLEDILEGIGLKLGIGRIRALAVCLQAENFIQLVAVCAEFARFGADHQGSVAACGDGHARALKQRPEAREVAGVCVVGLVAVDDQRVELFTAQNRRAALHSFLILVIGDADSLHVFFLH